MDANDLRSKINWEGDVLAAIDYGIRADDIEDEDLSDAWNQLLSKWEDLSDQVEDFEDLLNDKCDALEDD